MRNGFKVAMAVVLAIAPLSACGDDEDESVLRPVAYGENGQCYYVEEESEVEALYADGLCEPNWVPTLVPIVWYNAYYPYYSSPAYYNRYVSETRRNLYVRTTREYGVKNSGAISQAASRASYVRASVSNPAKVLDKKPVKGNKVSTTQFGSGSRKTGGGARCNSLGRVGVESITVAAGPLMKPPGGGGGGSRVSGGGGSRNAPKAPAPRNNAPRNSNSKPGC